MLFQLQTSYSVPRYKPLMRIQWLKCLWHWPKVKIKISPNGLNTKQPAIPWMLFYLQTIILLSQLFVTHLGVTLLLLLREVIVWVEHICFSGNLVWVNFNSHIFSVGATFIWFTHSMIVLIFNEFHYYKFVKMSSINTDNSATGFYCSVFEEWNMILLMYAHTVHGTPVLSPIQNSRIVSEEAPGVGIKPLLQCKHWEWHKSYTVPRPLHLPK